MHIRRFQRYSLTEKSRYSRFTRELCGSAEWCGSGERQAVRQWWVAIGAESGTAGVFTRAAPLSVPPKWTSTSTNPAALYRYDLTLHALISQAAQAQWSKQGFYLLRIDFHSQCLGQGRTRQMQIRCWRNSACRFGFLQLDHWKLTPTWWAILSRFEAAAERLPVNSTLGFCCFATYLTCS